MPSYRGKQRSLNGASRGKVKGAGIDIDFVFYPTRHLQQSGFSFFLLIRCTDQMCRTQSGPNDDQVLRIVPEK